MFTLRLGGPGEPPQPSPSRLPSGFVYADSFEAVLPLLRRDDICGVVWRGDERLTTQHLQEIKAHFGSEFFGSKSFCGRPGLSVEPQMLDFMKSTGFADSYPNSANALAKDIALIGELVQEFDTGRYLEGRLVQNWRANDRPHTDGRLTAVVTYFGATTVLYGPIDGQNPVGKKRRENSSLVKLARGVQGLSISLGEVGFVKGNGVHAGPQQSREKGLKRLSALFESMKVSRFAQIHDIPPSRTRS